MRWIFAAIGFLYFRFVGALVGYWVGYMLERTRIQIGRIPGPDSQQRSQMRVDILQDFLTLTMAIARADGDLDRREIRTIKQFFQHSMNFSGNAMTWLQDALKAEAQHPGNWQQAADRLRHSLTPLDLTVLMRTLVQVAQSDGHIATSEKELLQQIAQQWGMLGPQFDAWQQPRNNGKDRQWALGILGLSGSASKEEIDKAYKRLVREKHPDKFAHLGEEFQKEAHEQFVEIQEAYQLLKS